MNEIQEIYADNYRGFEDTLIPLKDVNFFVGENSTGKTSILKLLDLLASSEFWFKGNFRNENVDFSYYGDLAENLHVSRTKLGVMFEGKDKEHKTSYAKIILKSGANNQTSISSFHLISEGRSIRIQAGSTPRSLKYSIEPFEINTKELNFKTWCQDDEKPVKLKDLKIKKGQFFMRDSPFFLTQHVLNKHSKDSGDKELTKRPPSILNTFGSYSWIAPIRMKPQQTYDGNVYEYSADGAHTPYTLRDIFDKKKTKNSSEIINSLEEFGKASGLFDSIKSKRYSKEGNAPFSIDVVMKEQTRHITEVGYGVSQVLPILISILGSNYSRRYEIQQPEVHLHPRAQASLGGLFYDIVSKNKAQLIIETHSDFLIDRFRQKMSQEKKNLKAQVVYFEKVDGKNRAHLIPIEKNGTYSESQPEAFRNFFLNEEMNNLTI